jgi:hypothetical protein
MPLWLTYMLVGACLMGLIMVIIQWCIEESEQKFKQHTSFFYYEKQKRRERR